MEQVNTIDIIFNLLEQNNKTQQEFAKAIGVTKSQISEWKNHKTNSYNKYLKRIADYFNISIDSLLKIENQNESIFYKVILQLCKERNISISKFTLELGLSKSNVTMWKSGSIPNTITLTKISNYFDVSLDYLLGIKEQNNNLTSQEMEFIKRIRLLDNDIRQCISEELDILLNYQLKLDRKK